MIKKGLVNQASTAVVWKIVQQGGVYAIFLIRIIFLARILSPKDFGLVAIAITAIGFLSKVTDFGMVPALVQQNKIDENHYHTAWTVGILRAIIIAGTVLLTAPIIANIFEEPKAINIIRVISILPLTDGLASIKVADLTRMLKFRSLAIVKFAEAVSNTIISIILVYFIGVWALVAGTLVGSISCTIVSYALAPYRPKIFFNRMSVKPLIHFGKWIFLTSLIAISSNFMLRIIIARKIGTDALGLYFLASKLAFLPTILISEVIGSVAFPLYARLRENIKKTSKAFRKILNSMLVALIPVYALMTVLAPSLSSNILGHRWDGTGSLIQILAIIGIIGILSDAAVPVFQGLGQPYKFAIIEGSQSLILIIFALVLIKKFGIMGAVLAWFPAISCSLVASFFFIHQSLIHPFKRIVISILAIIIASGIGASIALSIDQVIPNLFGFILAGSLSISVIGILIWIFDNKFRLEFINDFAFAFPTLATLFRLKPTKV